MNSNTSQAFGFQTGSMSDKQGSLKVKLAHLEVSSSIQFINNHIGFDQRNHRGGRVSQERSLNPQSRKRTVRKCPFCQSSRS